MQQLGNDRIVDFQFGSDEAAYHLIIELYDRVSGDPRKVSGVGALAGFPGCSVGPLSSSVQLSCWPAHGGQGGCRPEVCAVAPVTRRLGFLAG